MKNIEYTIKDPLGIHARPAGNLVKQALKYQCSIKIIAGTRSADAKRLFSVMAMAVKCGETIRMAFEGEDEKAAADEMLKFLQENL